MFSSVLGKSGAATKGGRIVSSIPHIVELEPKVNLNDSVGHDYNLILLVKDHAPQRINTIEKELVALAKRVDELNAEQATLKRLVAALNP